MNATRLWMLGCMLCFLSPCCHGFAQHATPLQQSMRRRSLSPFAAAQDSEVNPRQLTGWLRDAASPRALFKLHSEHGHEFNQIHISAGEAST